MHPVKIIAILACIVSCIAYTESLITTDVDADLDICLNDDRIANICLKCSSFPFYAIPPLDTCCSEKGAFLLCEACVNARDSCELLMKEIEELDSLSEDGDGDDGYYDDIDKFQDSEQDVHSPDDYAMAHLSPVTSSVEKRFGRLFVNRNPKRFGKIFFGKRSEQNVESDDDKDEIQKRFGRVFMGRGSYFGKRSEMDKRFGRLFTTSNNYFGKRAPYTIDELLDDKFDDNESDDLNISKRYGRIYMGNRRNKMYGKRYGRIFFGKRSDDNMDKRVGTLHMGNMDKRYGRLFTGRRKYYFGK